MSHPNPEVWRQHIANQGERMLAALEDMIRQVNRQVVGQLFGNVLDVSVQCLAALPMPTSRVLAVIQDLRYIYHLHFRADLPPPLAFRNALQAFSPLINEHTVAQHRDRVLDLLEQLAVAFDINDNVVLQMVHELRY
ncbi:hypothetical protein, variant 2 [Saprolegnia diclina VS20]|uniref:Uncharacterized protein n=1 Tax=Saprolegnia diclina (strain VS20) TaxID=1156394 RepID=T0Q5Z6_SAPDV|nr:hypothetical protein SDRG_13376 [Saprolegnia diclina VS20]XP_008617682.1 hypothetical protein, variant 1 [Saprolegnia diclina VS20]XP_008617683.1 hypothetical protein, variant 2 [Saprolegnia diclina VS20]EQC28864.1 hypothetical protein SDRG_13376 [Saprolegnia diclina VS20]EQC28865.1 hypothetical protein, variant 1 [Saprolegnia diclina VS20]EQC28866.1 hypothetical protein, variant 2 [Saprolegnia diclina VS20]|eukprot:XP_008617681.1 hypothetical protein SDRG_13376 [Saprolegnia diclina VS20]